MTSIQCILLYIVFSNVRSKFIYLTSLVIFTRGSLVLFHSFRLFIIYSAGILLIRTDSSICLFVGSLRHLSITCISKGCGSLLCTFTQCFHKALSSFIAPNSSLCLFPLVYAFCPVCPVYSYLHPSEQLILYVTPVSLQPPGFGPLHTIRNNSFHSHMIFL